MKNRKSIKEQTKGIKKEIEFYIGDNFTFQKEKVINNFIHFSIRHKNIDYEKIKSLRVNNIIIFSKNKFKPKLFQYQEILNQIKEWMLDEITFENYFNKYINTISRLYGKN